MSLITELYIAGAGGTARSILLGGGPNKSAGAAIKAIRQQFAASIPSGTAGYNMARGVVRRVQTLMRAAERVSASGAGPVTRLPRDPSIFSRPDINYSYRAVVEFKSRATGRTYRTVTTVVSQGPMLHGDVLNAAQQQVRDDVNYPDKRNRRQVKTLRGYDVTYGEIIMAGRK